MKPVKTWSIALIFSLVLTLGLTAVSVQASTSAPTPAAHGSADGEMLSMPLADIQRFATAIAQIKRYYIEPVTDQKLFNYAISGMLSSLDPHSSYLDADALRDLKSATSGEFSGVGVEVIPDQGFIKVISPVDDTPAAKAGIKPGDLIIKVNDKLVNSMSIQEAINLIRGKKGTQVKLTIVRKGETKPLIFDLTRDTIKIQTVKSKMLEPGYAYVRVAFFQEHTDQDLRSAISKLKKESPQGKLNGLILDLRNNPGGLLDASTAVADTFLDEKKLNKKYKDLIVYTKGRIPNADIQVKATPGDIVAGVPMVVLINGGSASASEIVAGALQDYHRAVIVGTKSFGKGSVQTVLPIDYESAIKLTTALYYTPAGRSIQATGIEPDVVIATLQLPKSNTEDVLIDPISEASLEKHLENGNGKKQPNATDAEQASKLRKQNLELAQNDFQLYEALNLLKGLHALKQ